MIRVARRDDVLRCLHDEGIGAGIHYPVPVHLQPAFRHLGYGPGDFPVAEAAAGQLLSLPLYPQYAKSSRLGWRTPSGARYDRYAPAADLAKSGPVPPAILAVAPCTLERIRLTPTYRTPRGSLLPARRGSLLPVRAGPLRVPAAGPLRVPAAGPLRVPAAGPSRVPAAGPLRFLLPVRCGFLLPVRCGFLLPVRCGSLLPVRRGSLLPVPARSVAGPAAGPSRVPLLVRRGLPAPARHGSRPALLSGDGPRNLRDWTDGANGSERGNRTLRPAWLYWPAALSHRAAAGERPGPWGGARVLRQYRLRGSRRPRR